MSHLVETMAYTNQVPWHGLGEYIAKAPTVKAMLKRAKLDWHVDREPVHVLDRGKPIEVDGFAALVRDRDRSVLDIVGSKYTPAQNEDVFEFFTDFVEAGGATMETAGSLKGGRYVWGLASLNASFKMKGNDTVKGYLLVASPHEHGKSLIVRFTSVRVVCNNTLTLALGTKGTEFRMNHRNVFDNDMMDKAKDALGIAREQLGEFEANARALQGLRMTEKDVITVLAPHFQRNFDQAKIKSLVSDFDGVATPNFKKVMHAYEHAPGAQVGNAWGALNAVTYFADHIAGRTADKRLERAWIGSTASLKEKVLVDLLEMAE